MTKVKEEVQDHLETRETMGQREPKASKVLKVHKDLLERVETAVQLD